MTMPPLKCPVSALSTSVPSASVPSASVPSASVGPVSGRAAHVLGLVLLGLLAACGSSDAAEEAATTGADVTDPSGADVAADAIPPTGVPDAAPDGRSAGPGPACATCAWRLMDSPTSQPLHDVWGDDADDMWAVGSGGAILRFDGAAWSSEAGAPNVDFLAIWGSGAQLGGDVWAVGAGGTILHLVGDVWSAEASGTEATLRGVCGMGNQNVWAVGDGGVVRHFDGTAWSAVPDLETDLIATWTTPDGLTGAIAAGQAYRVDAETNTFGAWDVGKALDGGTLADLWGSGAAAMWAVGSADGDKGLALRWNGELWLPIAVDASALIGVWASGPSDAWFLQQQGPPLHFDGQIIRSVTPPAMEGAPTAVFGVAPDDAWIVSSAGEFLHWSP